MNICRKAHRAGSVGFIYANDKLAADFLGYDGHSVNQNGSVTGLVFAAINTSVNICNGRPDEEVLAIVHGGYIPFFLRDQS